MTTPSYIAYDIDDLLEQAPPDIQELISGTEVNNATAILGKLYKIPVSSYVALSNIISFILIGALKPEDAVRAIVDILELPEEEAYKLAADLDKTILEKARISILGKSPKDMVTLTFQEGRSPNELRKEILDTTKHEAVPISTPPVPIETISTPLPPPPIAEPAKKTAIAGSRSQLLEQLQILDAIPDDEEITQRLKKIQEQITGMTVPDERALEPKVALQEFMPKEGEEGAVAAESKSASYSKAPTQYNVDPYREPAV
jgi:hypothetical protein